MIVHNILLQLQIHIRSFCWQRVSAVLCICFVLVFFMPFPVNAEAIFQNEETGYQVIIEDDADLLTLEEEDYLISIMKEITDYGNVALKTISDNYTTTEQFIKDYYWDQFGSVSGTVFLIDMDERNIWIHSNGAVYETVTKSYANTITDNIYTYATKGEYYTCCYNAFKQELALLQGQKIAQPMKYLSNAFFAIVLALLVNYFLVKIFSSTKKPSDSELMKGLFVNQSLTEFDADFTHTTREYSPQSSDSSGGSSGGSGGGSSGGGGGGHSF